MAEPKVQLVAPIGNITVPGMNVTGVVTATIGDVGVAGSIIQGNNIDIGAGIITATSFVGDQIGTYRAASLTGTPDLVIGVVTASSYVGDVTGAATSIIQGTNTNAGTFNATTFVGNVTGDITGDVIGNVSGIGASIKQGNNLNVGIATAWKWYGDGSGLTGVGASAYSAQNVTASTAETIIDLTYGNLVYLTQSADTTVGFASTAATQNISIVRNTNSSNTITWPDRVKWNNDTTPTLFSDAQSAALQVFRFMSVDSGLTYNAWEEMKNDPAGPYELYGWGNNAAPSKGILGQNNETSYSSPTQIGSENTWSGGNVSKGDHPGLLAGFLKTDGTLWTWGKNQGGTLGQNQARAQLDALSSPTQVPGTTWEKATFGDYNVLMTKTDGTLWGMGLNEAGGLGLNDIVNRSSPTQIGTGTDWGSAELETTGAASYVIKSDNTLWVWGYAWGGKLGLNSWTQYSSPMQVPGSWTDLEVGAATVAVKTDGTLWTWGYVNYGNSGLNLNQTRYSSPVQVGTDTTWGSKVFSGSGQTGCIKTDGTLWMWGSGGYGGLAQNDQVSHSSPIQVGTETTWNDMAYGNNYILATKTNGELWAWGFNHATGGLGQNQSYVDRSSPVQIPGTWSDPQVAQNVSFAFKDT